VRLVDGPRLVAANAALGPGLGTNGAEAAGPLLAAALLPLLGCAGCCWSTQPRSSSRPSCWPLLGGWWSTGFTGAPVAAALLLVGFAVSSAGNLLTGLSWAVAVAFGLQAVRGLGLAAMDVGATTVLQRGVPDAPRGRVFGAFHGGIGVAAGLSYLAGGPLLDATSPRTTFLVAGGAGLVATAATLVGLRGRRRPDG
jgi:hypothetical protein